MVNAEATSELIPPGYGTRPEKTDTGPALKAYQGYGRDRAPAVSIAAAARGDVDAAVSAEMHGYPPDSVVVPANRDAALTAAREQLGGRKIQFAVEPSVARFALPDWEEKKTLQELPYRPFAGELYDERLLEDPERLRTVARSAIKSATENGADRLLAPWIVAEKSVDLQMLVNLRLLGSTLVARDELYASRELPVIATVALPAAAIVDPVARIRIANSLAGYEFDACRLALRDLGTSSPRAQIIAAVDLALLLQESEKPVFVMVSSPLRELFWAAGIAGVEAVPARRQRPSLPRYRPGSGAGWTPSPRFEIRSLMAPLAPEAAIAVLEGDAVPEADCNCPGCAGVSVEGRVRRPAAHNVLTEVSGAVELDGVAPDGRCELLRERLRDARRLGRELVMRGLLGNLPDATGRLEGALNEIEIAGLITRPARPRLRRAS